MYREYRISPIDTESTLELLSYYNSSNYQAAIIRERKEILDSISRKETPRRPEELDTPAISSAITHVTAPKDLPERASVVPAGAKSKSKSRPKDRLPISSPLAETQTKASTASTKDPVEPILSLPKKAKSLNALRLLFPETVSDLKGTVNWMEFVAMMNELGFRSDHRGGSEWTFKKIGERKDEMASKGLQVNRSIVLHQPHPDLRMDAIKVRWLGKRLGRRFGWTRESFQGL